MKSKYSHVLTLIGAILAFVPIVAVDYLLDTYVRAREETTRSQFVGAVSAQIQTGTNDAIAALRRVIADSPSLCTPTFVANVQAEIEGSLNLRQVLVENADGVQYCDAIGRTVTYSPLSASLPIPGQTETITVVQLGDMAVPALKITQAFGQTRRVSAFIPLIGQTPNALAQTMPRAAAMRVQLTNGTTVLTIGDTALLDRQDDKGDYIYAQGFAGELPIKVESAVPFAMARAAYADLDVSFTVIACIMSGAFLLLSLNYVRRSRVPAFDLERAIARGEIKPYYQPVINLRTGQLMGCEVLCRWEKKKGVVVPPGAFIDYAEVTGLAIPMTLSLMQQVRQDLGDLCVMMPEIKISINLFEGHFRDDSIVEDVQAIFGNSKIGMRQLVFEITERHPLGNSAVANSVIAGLHALGCKLALDDAGTGHSNLAYIGTLGVDIIKIDRVFVDMVKPGTTQVPVLDGLIVMAKDMDCEIVAEGVETEEQAIYLRARGVVQAQGFIFAPALKVGAFRELATALHATHEPRSRIQNIVASAA
ncbi:MAG: EAL domain-containing protein [Candidatus Devosia phytovorans]|uniref:EAL domain-containing protein n=1 Tax=Candidatus Devosia phytovorans TaxID=3121372 RepID=A0AAJ5VXL9_9HYPH|nr:EAL domain-containing protein [Devosia sp.]WEK06252.1 MAG: EAL domain-containing protein [Devosia sp.]